MKQEEKYIPEGHKEIEVWYIGEITFPEELALQEAEFSRDRRLNIKSIDELKLEVYSGEGAVPHFHLFKKDHSFESCICIYSNNFFSHGGKYRDVLNNKQCKILNDYLLGPCKQNPNMSVWNMIMGSWESGNPNCSFPKERKTLIQPDYSMMSQFRDK